jgi:hypothetical protein
MERVLMTRTPESSNIEALGYSNSHSQLFVMFKSGRVYVYDGVGEDVFRGMLAAESKGSYFARKIKHHYPSTLLTGDWNFVFEEDQPQRKPSTAVMSPAVDPRWAW